MTEATGGREPLAYYAAPGPFTDITGHAARLRALPETLSDLCHVVQGLVVHPFLASLYGLRPDALRQDDLQIRRASEMLDRILAVDPRPLSEPRPPERRFVGNCRHFTVLLCAFLRARAMPVRARCGFAAYFQRPRFEDHWVAEVWDDSIGAWRLVDAQLDARQRDALEISFDVLDVPRTEFLVAGDAWERCRRGATDPEVFGILDLRGLWFVRGNLVRDLAARAKRELLPWDAWGLMRERERESDPAEVALLDRVAELTRAGDDRHAEILELHDSEPRLRVPRVIVSLGPGGDAEVDLGAEIGGPGRSSAGGELPNVAEILGRVLQRVPPGQRPLLIAIAERMAAERYRRWAREPLDAKRQSDLRACADREEDITRRVEALYPDAAAIERDLIAKNPDLEEIDRSIFAGRPRGEQFTIQARAERLGAATWRFFAEHAEQPAARETFMACARLEEESAAVLESILDGDGRASP